ncbi:glycosyltransferase [Actinocorallia longicatena]|uniref:Glycosyltransferase n=1 Tax=Actinocorallia longicatena TaxID=111803 RepID=A0ABP6PWN6_9ACTN
MGTKLLVTHGTDGDVLPFVRLGSLLRERGHDVTVITHAPYGPAIERRGLGFVAIDTEAEYERQLADTAPLLAGNRLDRWRGFYERNGLFGQITAEYEAIAERHVPGGTVVIGRHTSALSALMAAEGLGAPAVWAAVSPIQIMAERPARHLYATALKSGLAGVRAAAGLDPVTPWGRPDLQLGFWPGWFDEAGARSSGTLLTGFPLADDRSFPVPPAAAELLQGPVPPIVVTGGTGRMMHPAFYERAVAGCAEAGLPALLVVRHRDLVPRPLPQNVHWVPALPFHSALAGAGAILHHGGIGTIARALVSGTPQVILAHGVDRPDNAERLAASGLAGWLPAASWRPDLIAALLHEAVRTGAETLTAADGLAGAVQEIERLAGTGRSTEQGPALPPGLSGPRRAALLKVLEARR